jgi:rare lipoprotein A
MLRALGVVVAVSVLVACGTTTSRTPPQRAPSERAPLERAPLEQKRGGGYYKDDGPGSLSPKELVKVPDAAPRAEPLSTRNNKPYRVHGKTYTPRTRVEPFKQSGVASWYGRRFHGRPTASGEKYNMYAMTAAHPTLPIPSYARVTSLTNGRSVVVRINDRGPFLHGRIIDLSYAAASKLDFISKGSARVEVEQILPGDRALVSESMPSNNPSGARASNTAPVHDKKYVSPTLPAMSDEPNGTGVDRVESSPEPLQETPGFDAGATSGTETVPGEQRLFLQLGVFASRENAESFRSRVSAQAADPRVKTEMVAEGGYFRIYAGPYVSATEARTVAGWIEEQMGFRPFIVRRD